MGPHAAGRLRSGWWRVAEVIVSGLALVVLLPVLLLLGACIVLTDGFPILFRQSRIGRGGQPFELLKLRSMRKNNSGMQVTQAGDPRVTTIGHWLRRYKLDEIPQLWNVIRGEMAIVGPRPEVPRYVDAGDARWSAILRHRPGITDLPTLLYRNEEEILAAAADPEGHYREVVLPDKLSLNLAYARSWTPLEDLRLILLSIRYSVWPSGFDAAALRSRFTAK
jgi:lipopolysaccharide/colanic/teichoic acid biosynthesis glycosyltransferase